MYVYRMFKKRYYRLSYEIKHIKETNFEYKIKVETYLWIKKYNQDPNMNVVV